MKILKKNYKLLIGFILGLVVTGTGVYAVTVISSNQISYDNTSSKLSSTNLQDALDELSTKTELKNRDNIVEGYTYNQTTSASNYCVTGEESTCVKTTCYKSTTANSCKAGDIIKYKVNDTDIVTFHVMYDNGTTMTMQSQKNVVYNTPWISSSDYALENTDGTSCGYTSCNDEGPMTVLVALERVTSGWKNVNNQTYSLGKTTFKISAFTGCSSYNSCTNNTYTLDSRTSKARMITIQEAFNLGCTTSNKTCPIWIYNYLYNSTGYGGTKNDAVIDIKTGQESQGYSTSSVNSGSTIGIWGLDYCGRLYSSYSDHHSYGARAVVVISK